MKLEIATDVAMSDVEELNSNPDALEALKKFILDNWPEGSGLISFYLTKINNRFLSPSKIFKSLSIWISSS